MPVRGGQGRWRDIERFCLTFHMILTGKIGLSNEPEMVDNFNRFLASGL